MPSGKNPRRRIVHFDEMQRLFSLECGHMVVLPPWRLRLQTPKGTKECRECGDVLRMSLPPCKTYFLACFGRRVVHATRDGFIAQECDIERHGRHKLNKWGMAWAADWASAVDAVRKGQIQWYVRCQCGGSVPLSVAN